MPPLLASRRAVAYGWLAGDRPEAPTFPPPSTCLVESELEKKRRFGRPCDGSLSELSESLFFFAR